MLSPWASLPLASAWASTCPACCGLDGLEWLGCWKKPNVCLLVDDEHSYIYPLVIQHSHGKSLINGGFNEKIIYKWAIFHSYVSLPEGII